MYMSDLQALEATATHTGFQAATPLQLAQWDEALAEQSYACYIRTGIWEGFYIGAD
jgi:hypothetical protein